MTNNLKQNSFVVDKPGARLDKYVGEKCPELSRTYTQKLIGDGYITVNSQRGKAGLKVNSGDRVNVIIGGHQRVRVAERLGMTEIPCTYLDLEIDRERELNIRLNQNLGEWDWDALSDYFDISELEEWGFDERELEFEFITREPLNLPDELPESDLVGEIDGMGHWLIIRFDAETEYQEMLDYLQLEEGARTIRFFELRPHLDGF